MDTTTRTPYIPAAGDISRHLLAATATVRDALTAINALSGDAMTLFVTDAGGRVAGTLTDGDIRRALIGGSTLGDPVATAMNTAYTPLRHDDEPYGVIRHARARGIDLLPRLDEDGRLEGIVDLRRVRNILPLDAVLMAGGRGERLRPLTLATPKPLLEVDGRPIIDYNIEELASNGIDNIFVTVNYLREQLMCYFSEPRHGVRVRCVGEPCRLGTIGSLALVEGLRHDDVLLMNSDLLTTLDFGAMYAFHRDSGAELTIGAVPYTVSVPFAIMKTDGDRVTALEEKPTYNYFANGGVYMLKRRLIERIVPGEPLDAPDFVDALIADGQKVSFFPIDGLWVDIGSPHDYRHACSLMQSRRKATLHGI